jgi:membrane associated rhomboid family serine protease
MATIADDLLLEVLKACDQAPPLYPAAFAEYSGLERHLLDQALDSLRLRGLVRFTDWERDKGQGYAVTSLGAQVLENPGLLKRVKRPAPEAPPPDRSRTPWSRGEAVRDALLNPVRPIVTMTLLAINIVVFVTGIPQTQGALIASDVLFKDEWWRLLSNAFFHWNILHIALNMYALYTFGPLLETMWGSVRYLLLYLIGALGCSCAVMLQPAVQAAVGASGALCGLVTSFGVWVYLNRHSLPPNLVSAWMRNLFINIFLMIGISMMPNVSWAGHLGGAVAGALVSVPLNYQRFGRSWEKVLGCVGIMAVPALCLGLVVYEHRDPLEVRWVLSPRFRAAEDQAVTVFNSQAVPLLRAWQKEEKIDPARLPAARAAFQEADRELGVALKEFDKAGPFQNARVGEIVTKGRAYLEAWSTFFEQFTKTTELPLPWPEERFQALDQALKNVNRRRPPDNPLLPSPYYEKK